MKNLIGNKIAELREKNNLTQAELAKKLNVTDKTISKWECGEVNPNLNLLPLIADYFGVNIDDLFGHKHDFKEDIEQAVFNYMKEKDIQDELTTLRNISFKTLFGLIYKHCIINNGKEVADSVFFDIALPDKLGRPTVYACPDGYVRSVENENLNFQIINITPKDNFSDMFKKYENYRYIFKILSIPNAEKVIKYLYNQNSTEDCTIEYVAGQTNVSKETVKEIFTLMDYKKPQKVIINGEEVEVYHNLPSDEILSIICLAYGYTTQNHGYFGDIITDKKIYKRIIKEEAI